VVELPDDVQPNTNTNDRIRKYLNVDKDEYVDKEYQNLKNAGIYTTYIDNSKTHQATV
jgi:hypothetical protein